MTCTLVSSSIALIFKALSTLLSSRKEVFFLSGCFLLMGVALFVLIVIMTHFSYDVKTSYEDVVDA